RPRRTAQPPTHPDLADAPRQPRLPSQRRPDLAVGFRGGRTNRALLRRHDCATFDAMPIPEIDEEARGRLSARFGAEVGAWFEELPGVLNALAERWQVEFGSLIPRTSMSVVVHCRRSDGRPAVLKISPDRKRLANEAAALGRWTTVHTPSVLAVDESPGALLLEAIEPGMPLVDSITYPRLESMAE